MFYLGGQILLFVLVAVLLGAVLAWAFLIAPTRRARAAPASLAAAGARGSSLAVLATTEGEPSAAGDVDRLDALMERLRRQEERGTVETAELVTRLAAAERQAAESESRACAAERQVAAAVEQVNAAQARIAQIEAELRGATARDDAGETGRLRTALAEAETRAARFSSRLALTRTEAEEATREVRAVTERMERRQAEWAAERAALLVRIAEVEALVAARTGARERASAAARTATVAGLDAVSDHASVYAVGGIDAMSGSSDIAGSSGHDLFDNRAAARGAQLATRNGGQARAARSQESNEPVASAVGPAGGEAAPGPSTAGPAVSREPARDDAPEDLVQPAATVSETPAEPVAVVAPVTVADVSPPAGGADLVGVAGDEAEPAGEVSLQPAALLAAETDETPGGMVEPVTAEPGEALAARAGAEPDGVTDADPGSEVSLAVPGDSTGLDPVDDATETAAAPKDADPEGEAGTEASSASPVSEPAPAAAAAAGTAAVAPAPADDPEPSPWPGVPGQRAGVDLVEAVAALDEAVTETKAAEDAIPGPALPAEAESVEVAGDAAGLLPAGAVPAAEAGSGEDTATVPADDAPALSAPATALAQNDSDAAEAVAAEPEPVSEAATALAGPAVPGSETAAALGGERTSLADDLAGAADDAAADVTGPASVGERPETEAESDAAVAGHDLAAAGQPADARPTADAAGVVEDAALEPLALLEVPQAVDALEPAGVTGEPVLAFVAVPEEVGDAEPGPVADAVVDLDLESVAVLAVPAEGAATTPTDGAGGVFPPFVVVPDEPEEISGAGSSVPDAALVVVEAEPADDVEPPAVAVLEVPFDAPGVWPLDDQREVALRLVVVPEDTLDQAVDAELYPAPVLWGGLAEPGEPGQGADNLKEIVGVGPITEARLHALGITRFRQIAALGDTDVDRLAVLLDGFGGKIVSDDWVGQARELVTRYQQVGI